MKKPRDAFRDDLRTALTKYLGCDEMELGLEWEAYIQAVADVTCLSSHDATLAVGRLALAAAEVVKL